MKEENVIVVLYYPGFYGERMARILQESNDIGFSGPGEWWKPIDETDRFTDLVEFKKFRNETIVFPKNPSEPVTKTRVFLNK